EGLVLALAATIVFVIAIRRDSLPLSVASGVLYLLAALAKEVFVPLPLLLVAMPWRAGGPPAGPPPARRREENTRRRAAGVPAGEAAGAPLVALIVYVVWRITVAGASLHGYGWASGNP